MRSRHHPRTWQALTFTAGPWDNLGILILAATEREHSSQVTGGLAHKGIKATEGRCVTRNLERPS